MRLTRDFYLQDSYSLAKALIGKLIVIANQKWRIVETEAYGGATDRAAHSYNNLKTKRTETMYLEGGHVYIYFIYGMYYMLNIVANHKDIPEAVLIRAVAPTNNINSKLSTNGPGKLCKHLRIDKTFNEIDLVESDKIYIEDDGFIPNEIVESTRVGIDYALEDKDRLWRFYLKDNPYVSKI